MSGTGDITEGVGKVVILDDEKKRVDALSQYFGSDHGDDDAEGREEGETPVKDKSKRKSADLLARMKAGKGTPKGTNQTGTGTGGAGGSGSGAGAGTGGADRNPPPPTDKNSFRIEGTNIGSRASEPEWTNEDLQAIATACGIRIGTVMLSETRRSIPDPEGKYLMTADNGTTVTKPAAILPTLTTNEYKLGLGKVKPDEKTGKSKLYSDVVIKGSNWILSQWTSKNVIMEGVADNILDKPPRMINGKPERRIGHDFARFGFPKTSFGPVFETLKSIMPSILDGISTTRGYYWMNASWGVTGSPGNFVYAGTGKIRNNTHKLYEAMKMLAGQSSMGAAAIAISIAGESKMEGGKLVPANAKYELSVKVHNMFHIKKVSFRSPPQASATGFEVTSDIYDEAEVLEAVSGMGTVFNDTSSAFPSANPFFSAISAMQMPGTGTASTDKLLM
jgi:hypothetical protein